MNHPGSSGRRRAAAPVVALVLALASTLAQAVPSFARQTGQPCGMCHVGGFGPQLTDFGIQFKLTGYTLAKGGDRPAPLAGMVMAGMTHTCKYWTGRRSARLRPVVASTPTCGSACN
jgi:hypothetical protein